MTSPQAEPLPCAIKTFLDNAEQMAKVLRDLGELDEPGLFKRDLKAARSELASLRANVGLEGDRIWIRAPKGPVEVLDVFVNREWYATESHPINPPTRSMRDEVASLRAQVERAREWEKLTREARDIIVEEWGVDGQYHGDWLARFAALEAQPDALEASGDGAT